jgi:molecular chaperone GrpE
MTPNEQPFSPPDAAEAVAPDSLAERLAGAENEAAELKDAFIRAKAETENVRKQGQADVARAHKYAVDRFASELLPVKDALELALASPGDDSGSLREGVALTLKQLQAVFGKFDISEIVAQGEKFDPHRHQAMAMIDSEAPPNTVAQVFQKGYLLNDRVLRPALVAVAKPKGNESATS